MAGAIRYSQLGMDCTEEGEEGGGAGGDVVASFSTHAQKTVVD